MASTVDWVFPMSILLSVMLMTLASSVNSRPRRSDDISSVSVVVERLSQTVDSLQAQLIQQANSFTAHLNSVNAEITALKSRTDKLNETIAFYAWNNANVQTAPDTTLTFNHVLTNVGNAYDPLTGTFEVPVSGLYQFQSSIMSRHTGPAQQVYGAMYVDGMRVALGIADTGHGHWDQTMMSCVVRVQAGQRVYVKNPENVAKDYFDSTTEPYTTFSGSLIKAD